MDVPNQKIADMFNEMADLLDIEGNNPFRVRAYRNASRIVSDFPQKITDLVAQGKDLTQWPGIGKSLAEKIATIVKTGRLPQLEAEEKRIPPVLVELTKISGLGPKRIKAIYYAYHIKSIADLQRLVDEGKIAALPGFGEKTESAIKAGLKQLMNTPLRLRLDMAAQIADEIVAYLQKYRGLEKLDVAGSYRRYKETVGDLDLLAIAKNGEKLIQYFVKYPEVARVLSRGETRSTILLKNGFQIDLRVMPKESYGAALYYFTGSKSHNIAVRKIALKHKLKINEYGIFKGKRQVGGKSEHDIFSLLNMQYVEPELRENNGEIEAALENRLPKLVQLSDIRGDLHSHTNETDGHYTLAEMAAAAQAKGYEYLAITDHSQRLTVANGLDKKRLLAQIKAIDALNEQLKGFTILKAIEVDILEDGSLDLPDDVLKELDLTVCSVHSKFNLSEKKQTERIIRAMDNPYFKILGHPTGRLLNRRSPYVLDLSRLLQAAKERGCFVELNAQPERLDFSDIYCRMAKEVGVKVAISTDAHSIYHFDFMRFGVGQARRGWLEAKDVINTRPLRELRRLLQQ
jgi:DNA polymerase (family 10)